MLDFNPTIKSHGKNNDVMITFNMLLDDALSYEKSIEPKRKYLGASRLGVPCSRALQYEYSKAIGGNHNDNIIAGDTRVFRNFEIGHLFESLMIDWLKLSGFELITHDKEGNQLGFKVAGGKIAGHIDGIITKVPSDIKNLNRNHKDLNINCPCLWETKSMNNRSWKETAKNGLVLSKPVYAAQIAMYQAYMEEIITGISKNPCFFTAINKDTAEIYAEVIPFDSELAQRMRKCTVAELSELFNLTERRVYQLIEEQIIPKASSNKYELKEALQAYVKYLQNLASNRNSSSEQKILKTRLLAAQAEKAELELEVLKDKYMEVSEIEFEWSNLLVAFRSKMLVLSTKLVRPLSTAVGNFAETQRILEEAIYEALLELSKYDGQEESDSKSSQQQISTAAKVDREPMGRSVPQAI